MIWLMSHMWVYLTAAFLLGMLGHRWMFGSGGGLSAEDVSAELASVRTRHQEAEAERARLRAKVLELTHQLDEARREVRSAKAEAHAAGLKGGGAPSVAPDGDANEPHTEKTAESPRAPESPKSESPKAEPPKPAPPASPPAAPSAAAPETPAASDASELPAFLTAPAAPAKPASGAAPDAAETAAPATAAPGVPAPPRPREPIVQRVGPERRAGSPFLSSPEQGAPDDLKKIKGVGAKLEKRLHALGVYYFSQIASWTDDQVAEVDEQLQFPGRVERDDWRGQARTLAERKG